MGDLQIVQELESTVGVEGVERLAQPQVEELVQGNPPTTKAR